MQVVFLFNEPYPAPERTNKELLNNLGIGAFVSIFLVVFQPFGIGGFEIPNKYWFLSGFGVVTFLVTQTTQFLLPRIFPIWFQEKHWTVGRQVLFTFGTILLISLANAAYTWLIFPRLHFWGILPTFLIYTFSIGFFPVLFSVILKYSANLKRFSRPAALQIPEHEKTTPTLLQLNSENGKDILVVESNSLVFLESEDNYVTATYLKDGKTERHLLRSTLSRLETMLPNPPFVRCHRSFVANSWLIVKVTGNAQGYKLHFVELSETVPVARKYGQLVKDLG
jgi:hypothetical protein